MDQAESKESKRIKEEDSKRKEDIKRARNTTENAPKKIIA